MLLYIYGKDLLHTFGQAWAVLAGLDSIRGTIQAEDPRSKITIISKKKKKIILARKGDGTFFEGPADDAMLLISIGDMLNIVGAHG